MENRIITNNDLTQYQHHLIREEKSAATVEKYLRDVRAFSLSMDGAAVTKEGIVGYKKSLEEQDTYHIDSREAAKEAAVRKNLLRD